MNFDRNVAIPLRVLLVCTKRLESGLNDRGEDFRLVSIHDKVNFVLRIVLPLTKAAAVIFCNLKVSLAINKRTQRRKPLLGY